LETKDLEKTIVENTSGKVLVEERA